MQVCICSCFICHSALRIAQVKSLVAGFAVKKLVCPFDFQLPEKSHDGFPPTALGNCISLGLMPFIDTNSCLSRFHLPASGELTGTNEFLFFGCGVISAPWQLCLQSPSAGCLLKTFRCLPLSFSATSFGRQLCCNCCSTLPSTCANRTA